MKFDNIDDVLAFAIRKEEEAAALYRGLAERATRPGMREALLEFADQEDGHRRRLEAVRTGEIGGFTAAAPVAELGLDRHLSDVQPSPSMDYQQVLRLAIQAESTAQRLYDDLARLAATPSVAELFRSLAAEEAQHRQRFEAEYDDVILEGV